MDISKILEVIENCRNAGGMKDLNNAKDLDAPANELSPFNFGFKRYRKGYNDAIDLVLKRIKDLLK